MNRRIVEKLSSLRRTFCLTSVFLTLPFVLLAFTPEQARAEFSIGVGRDFTHARGTTSVTGRYEERPYRFFHYGANALVWDGPHGGTNGAVGADIGLDLGPVELGVGPGYILDTNDINGTNWNFMLTGAINLGDHFAIQITHFSNGKKLFHILQDKHNAGWNFAGLCYRF